MVGFEGEIENRLPRGASRISVRHQGQIEARLPEKDHDFVK
jgi:hypothetical protein